MSLFQELSYNIDSYKESRMLQDIIADRIGSHIFRSRPAQAPTLCNHGRFSVG
jgi:hypothetical protein